MFTKYLKYLQVIKRVQYQQLKVGHIWKFTYIQREILLDEMVLGEDINHKDLRGTRTDFADEVRGV